MTSRRILGVDPGSVKTGFAVIDFSGQKFTWIASGHLALGRQDMAARLGRIHRDLVELIATHKPDEAAIESVFVQKNVSSAIKLGQARGAAIAALACSELLVAEYSPAKVKQSICGAGRADKNQIQFMVRRLLNRHDELQEDEADALAIAICHAFHLPPQERRA